MIEWHDLNARHEAAILWVGAFLLYALAASSAVRQSVLGIQKALWNRFIITSLMGLIVVVAALAVAAVYIGRIAGLWETLPVITVFVWFVGSGVGLLTNFADFAGKKGEFKRAARALTPATIIAALTGIAILSFWWEVALFPILAILSAVFVHYDIKDPAHQLNRAVKAILLLYTLLLFMLAIRNLVQDIGTWKDLVQALLIPIWLTLGTLPYIRLLILVEQWKFVFRCPSKKISAADYGSDWPLVVDSAKLCRRHSAVWLEANGRKYGLNGTARTLLPNWGHTCSDLDEIWKDDPTLEGLKISIHRLLQDGLALEDR